MSDRLCVHGQPATGCGCCHERARLAADLGLPDLAALDRHPQARPCGCCALPLEPGEPTGTTPGGETVHASCTAGAAA